MEMKKNFENFFNVTLNDEVIRFYVIVAQKL